MLYSVVVELEPEGDEVIPATQGHHAHAAFISLVTGVDRGLGDRLHGPGAKPFTVSPLLGKFTPQDGGLRVYGGTTYLLRFTLLQDEPFAGLLAGLLAGNVRPIRLGMARFAVKQVHTQPTTSPWARVASVASLYERASVRPAVELEFLSPTAFSFGGGKSVVLPEPRLVFGSLLSRWRALSPDTLAPALPSVVEDGILVARYRLETKTLDYGRYLKTGFVGTCTFEVKQQPPEVVRSLNALADFAFFAGVGYKTTMGMGQVRHLLPTSRDGQADRLDPFERAGGAGAR